jgi:hypothetical protein
VGVVVLSWTKTHEKRPRIAVLMMILSLVWTTLDLPELEIRGFEPRFG